MFGDMKMFFEKERRERPKEPEFSTPRFDQPNTTIIAITNQKGGCGKTTTAINLSAGLATRNYKVLLIDLDAQSHASLGIGINIEGLTPSVYEVVTRNVDLESCIRPTYIENLDIAPATPKLSGAQLEIADLLGREGILRTALYKMLNMNKRYYDYVIIDSSPSLNLLTINGLVAATFLLIPLQTHYFSLEGMKELFSTIQIVRDRLNYQLQVLGILPTLFDSRTKMNKDIHTQLKSFFKDKVFHSTIRMNIKLAEATAQKKSIFDHAPHSKGAVDYTSLTEEIVALTRTERKDEARRQGFHINGL